MQEMMDLRYSQNSDGLIPSYIQSDIDSTNDNNFIPISNKIKSEILDGNMDINTYGTFAEEKHVYNAVWKENYFTSLENIYEIRGPKYKCEECNEMFCTKLSILTHSKFHRKPFCIACVLYFNNQQEMNQHLTTFHAALVELVRANEDVYYPELNTTVQTEPNLESIESVIIKEEPKTMNFDTGNKTKISSGRKLPLKPRSLFTRKKVKYESIENTLENPTRTLTSRFGRCITVKMPNY